jgi:holo-[acyl-carrier protein] synthase
MGIIGIGADIESISRFKAKPFDQNRDFYKKIFSPNEIKYCLGKGEPYQHFAVRFCAKEALIKALDLKRVELNSIEVIKVGSKPMIRLEGKRIHLSMSHEKDKALAFVVVEATSPQKHN